MVHLPSAAPPSSAPAWQQGSGHLTGTDHQLTPKGLSDSEATEDEHPPEAWVRCPLRGGPGPGPGPAVGLLMPVLLPCMSCCEVGGARLGHVLAFIACWLPSVPKLRAVEWGLAEAPARLHHAGHEPAMNTGIARDSLMPGWEKTTHRGPPMLGDARLGLWLGLWCASAVLTAVLNGVPDFRE